MVLLKTSADHGLRGLWDRERAAGLVLLLIGVGSVWLAIDNDFGSLAQMGPGFFPVVLGGLLVAIGLALIVAPAIGRDVSLPEDAATGNVEARSNARAWICIVLGMLAFAVCAQTLGLMCATFTCVFIAAWADRTASVKSTLALATAMTVFSVIVFGLMFRVQIPIVRGF